MVKGVVGMRERIGGLKEGGVIEVYVSKCNSVKGSCRGF